MSVTAYPEYQDSGVDWLGGVPAGWGIAILKRFLAEPMMYGANQSADDDTVGHPRFVRITDIDQDGNLRDDTFRSLPPEIAAPYLLTEGDILLARSGATVGKSFMYRSSWGTCCFAGYLIRARFRHAILTPDYVNYFCASSLYWAFIQSDQIQSTIPNFSAERYGAIPMPCPPTNEQSVIVAFLDHETAKIDALVAEQVQLIALLKEKRQAVISHAVTKGLDPNAPMKDSGVEWLGQVPAHWIPTMLGRVCIKVADGPHYSPEYTEAGILFISARNIRVDGWSLDDAKYISDEDYMEFCRRVVPEVGDVLYTKGGTTGIARVVDILEPFQVWVHVAVIKINKKSAVPYFIAYALNSTGCYEQSQLHTRGATNQDLGLNRMTKIWLALPPLNEQLEIVAYLDGQIAKLDSLVNEAIRVVDILKERRAALISAAVTGKIDVRGFVRPEQQDA